MRTEIESARDSAAGVNQSRARDHNERLLLSLIQRHGALPGSELARHAGLSPQTVSVILRQLEREGLLVKGEPIRGKVGKPSVPLQLAPDGIFSAGLKIGRRSAELVLMDSLGHIRMSERIGYRYPTPGPVFDFLEAGLARMQAALPPAHVERIAGIGIALPFLMWNWAESIGAPREEMELWRDFDVAARVAAFTDLPVLVENDATAACRAEHVFGAGSAHSDFAYIFVGFFIGGGIVLNRSVWDGRTGNAGALGSLPVGENGTQLIDHASLYLLEARLEAAGKAPQQVWEDLQDWSGFAEELEGWLAEAARHIARAAVSLAAVIDFESVVIDGSLPPQVRSALVAQARVALAREDSRGITLPELREGQIGPRARAVGAAALPIFSQYFLNTHA